MEKSKSRSWRGISNLDVRKLAVCRWVPGYLDLQINKASVRVARAADVHVYHQCE